MPFRFLVTLLHAGRMVLRDDTAGTELPSALRHAACGICPLGEGAVALAASESFGVTVHEPLGEELGLSLWPPQCCCYS